MKDALRNHLLNSCSDSELTRWFDPINIDISDENGEVVVTFPHAFFGQWFKSSIQDRFEEQLGLFLGSGFSVSYSNNGVSGNAAAKQISSAKKIDFPFGHNFTFENFLIGKKNYFPLASAREVTRVDNVSFNPFVICGKSGSGKSHLLKAIANEVSKKVDREKIFMGNIDDVQNIYSVRFGGDAMRARNHFFDYEYFFLDDLKQIGKYEHLQQELISIFNNFYENGKQMVFSCSDKLASYDFLDKNLKSRLEWGLIVTLKRPDLEIRASYVQKQCKLKKLPLTKDQILTLSQRFQDFRYLQGIIIKLSAFRELVRKNMDDRDFEHILSNTEEKADATLTPEYVIESVSEHFKLKPSDLTGSKRHKMTAHARQIAMYLCRELLGISYPALGRVFGGKDHSTVLYSVKKIHKLQKDDKVLKRLLIDLKNKCLLRVSN
ncbi:DnaA ATPase domain-containing protein [Maridesulfovibrio hydrothermalis]|uniref:Chromosomal replication initiator protein DnaA n=1 Tax=Maridesulfovibrio hydrothermalis AM13 = DSM 14728 TaxID=1121451 RepID=L0R8I2_9BACT|nr:DnaA/Hda family protein [Maridesulfovibrio hydrothermalis]CCO23073.1 Chromosomal replication initiator protein dnaA [Maridesulfovibrio hydrothermalis AM13 = DSM 14728]